MSCLQWLQVPMSVFALKVGPRRCSEDRCREATTGRAASRLGLALACTGLAIVQGCGGGGSSSSAVAAPASVISGTVVDAIIVHAQVSPYQINADGSIGAVIPCVPASSCPASSDANGDFTVNLGTYTGGVLLQATGGTYTDTVTGQTVALPSGLTLSVLLPSMSPSSSAVTAQLTPFTTIAAQLALQQVSQSAASATPTSLAAALQMSSTAVANAFGGISNLVNTELLNLNLANCSASASQASYDASLLLAGVAQLAANFGVNSIVLANAIGEDVLTDGVFDGLAAGAPIAVPLANGSGTVALTAIYGSGLGQALVGSIATFQGSLSNACKAALSVATGGALPTSTSGSLSSTSTYSYTLTGSVNGFTGSNTLELGYSVGLGCTNPPDVLVGSLSATSLKIYVPGNGAFSQSLTGSPNPYAPLNYNNACGTNSWTLRVVNSPGQSCSISPGSGAFAWTDGVGNHNMATASPVVSCSPVFYTVGGSVVNLTSGTVTITNTADGDSVTLSGNGSFTLPTPLADGTAYNVVATPTTCRVTGGNAAINSANVTNVGVNCGVTPSVYVVDSTNNLLAFDASGNKLAQVQLPLGISNINGGGITTDATNVYVTIGQSRSGYLSGAVVAFDKTTLAPVSLGAGSFAQVATPRGIVFDPHNSQFYVGNGGTTVSVYGASGNYLSSFPRGPSADAIYGPSGVAFDATHDVIWVANLTGGSGVNPTYGVAQFAENGSVDFDAAAQFVAPGNTHELPYAIGYCASASMGGTDYVAVGFQADNSGQGVALGAVYTTAGVLVGAFNPQLASSAQPNAISCSSAGTVYVAASDGLHTFSTSGTGVNLPANGFQGLVAPIFGVLAAY